MRYVLILLYVFFSVSGVILFKLGSSEDLALNISSSSLAFKISWLAILGLFFYILSFVIYMGLVSKNNLSYLIPVTTASVYIATITSSVVVFKENVTNIQIAGSVLILLGVILMNLPNK